MTIYDIAKEANVSASTVSRVINNKDGIKDETRKKVQRLLKKYNYCPNETARGLVNKSTKIIGILVSDIRNKHHTDGAYIIEREMTLRGYCCIIFNTGLEESSKAKYMKILEQRRVEGVVMIGSSFQCEQVKQKIQEHLSNVPIIMANGYIDLPNVYGVLVDECKGVSDCVKLLASKGHKKLAYVYDEYTPSAQMKIKGFKDGMNFIGWQGEFPVYQTEPTLQGGYDITKHLMQLNPDIDGIIYAVDLLAAGGCRALIDMNIKIPQQVSIIGSDNSIFGEICYPKLTTLDNKLLDLSITSAQILINEFEGRKSPNKVMLFSSIIEREST